MITIKIKNADEIVKNEKSWVISKIVPYFIDVQLKVEEAIVDQLKEEFISKNISAEFLIINDDEVRNL